MRLQVGDETVGPKEAKEARDYIIQMRDAALKQGHMEWALSLSHSIGIYSVMAEHVWGKDWLK